MVYGAIQRQELFIPENFVMQTDVDMKKYRQAYIFEILLKWKIFEKTTSTSLLKIGYQCEYSNDIPSLSERNPR